MSWSRYVLHIDMNSYFATVEQQCNPFLRGKPVAIGGSAGVRGVIVAASIEAKKYGIGVGMRHLEAKQLCPGIIFIDGDPDKYSFITQRFIDICKQYTDRILIYSIDEVFLDLTGWVKNIGQAIHKAQNIKDQVRREVGEYLTCSVGIAPNMRMAKVASNMKKPDGLTVISARQIPQVLKWLELTDMPGIARGLKVRLWDMGIRTLEQLGGYPVAELQKQFGPVMGRHISNMGKGIDTEQVPYIDEFDPTKSMGHRYTLSMDTLDRDYIYAVLMRLSEKVGRRLRRDHYMGRRIWVHIRWSVDYDRPFWGFSGKYDGITLNHFIDDSHTIYTLAKKMMNKWYFYRPVRLIGVGVTMLTYKAKQLTMLADCQKAQRLLRAQDKINDRYGENTIIRARALPASIRLKVGGFKEPDQFH